MDKWKESAHVLSHVWLFVAPRTVACQAPLSMEFPRQEYWSGLPFSSSGNLPNPEIKLLSAAMQADSLPLAPPRKPKSKVLCSITVRNVICRCWCSVQSPQSCPTICTSMHCSPPGSSVHGIPQAGILGNALLQGIFPTQGSNLHPLGSPALAGRLFTNEPGKPNM